MNPKIVLEIISTIIFFVAGIVTITKYSLKARVRMYLEATFLVANFLWLFFCLLFLPGSGQPEVLI